MTILETIVNHKRREVKNRKELYPTKLLEKSSCFQAPTVSMVRYLRRPDKSGIVAEFKRRSPSKGTINAYASVERTSIGYMQAGASALSILTDSEFFGGSNEDLLVARKFNFCPILRKDFIVDEYQIVEARSIGADAVLLIAAILSPEQCSALTALAHSLGLEVILEVHHEHELRANVACRADIIGVNNRDLRTFEVDVDISRRLKPEIPDEFLAISESGLTSPATIRELRSLGYEGFLVGENFMKHSRPEEEALRFIHELQPV